MRYLSLAAVQLRIIRIKRFVRDSLNRNSGTDGAIQKKKEKKEKRSKGSCVTSRRKVFQTSAINLTFSIGRKTKGNIIVRGESIKKAKQWNTIHLAVRFFSRQQWGKREKGEREREKKRGKKFLGCQSSARASFRYLKTVWTRRSTANTIALPFASRGESNDSNGLATVPWNRNHARQFGGKKWFVTEK